MKELLVSLLLVTQFSCISKAQENDTTTQILTTDSLQTDTLSLLFAGDLIDVYKRQGVGKAIKDIDIDDNAFKSIEAIIYSMTPAERSNPEILNGSRRTRIAKGSGTTIQEVNRLLKQFDQTRKMMKMVTSSKMGKMMPKMKK